MKAAEYKDKVEIILNIIREHSEGLSTEDLAKLTGLSRLTVSKYLFGMIATGKIKQRKVGPAKLNYLLKHFKEIKFAIIFLLSGFFVFNLFTTDGIAIPNFNYIFQEVFIQALQIIFAVVISILTGIFLVYKIVTVIPNLHFWRKRYV